MWYGDISCDLLGYGKHWETRWIWFQLISWSMRGPGFPGGFCTEPEKPQEAVDFCCSHCHFFRCLPCLPLIQPRQFPDEYMVHSGQHWSNTETCKIMEAKHLENHQRLPTVLDMKCQLHQPRQPSSYIMLYLYLTISYRRQVSSVVSILLKDSKWQEAAKDNETTWDDDWARRSRAFPLPNWYAVIISQDCMWKQPFWTTNMEVTTAQSMESVKSTWWQLRYPDRWLPATPFFLMLRVCYSYNGERHIYNSLCSIHV